MKKDDIFQFFQQLAEDNPAPETELHFGNAYQLVVAVAEELDVGMEVEAQRDEVATA